MLSKEIKKDIKLISIELIEIKKRMEEMHKTLGVLENILNPPVVENKRKRYVPNDERLYLKEKNDDVEGLNLHRS